MPTARGRAELRGGGIRRATGLGALVGACLCRSHGMTKSQEGESGGFELPVTRVAECVASNK